jgi:hypothetical protein
MTWQKQFIHLLYISDGLIEVKNNILMEMKITRSGQKSLNKIYQQNHKLVTIYVNQATPSFTMTNQVT